LTKSHNLRQEAFKDELNEKQKTSVKLIGVFFLIILIGYFFDKPNGHSLLLYMGIIIVIAIAVLEIKIAILHSVYSTLHRNFQFEIDRVTNEIDQYGDFSISDTALFYEYDESSEESKNKFAEITTLARIELELEILSFMNLEVELNYGY
jgi:hypothetical protein